MPWHRARWANPLLRLAGALLLGLAYVCGHRLFAAPIPAPGAREAGLALLFVVGLTSGSALVTLGAHLFDEVEVSTRWARRF